MDTSNYCVSENVTVGETVSRMETYRINAVIILGEDRTVKGLFTHGDMRRFFLGNGKLSDPITKAMNTHPFLFTSTYEAEKSEKVLPLYPIIDEEGKLIAAIDRKLPVHSNALKNVPVVIMAGGKGTRLQPYTRILPKALIPIGDLTISERIIQSFSKYGCYDYYMILNHKAGMIKAYFQDMEKEYSLQFVEEKSFLGTGGGLYYLKGIVDNAFFLSNCDILIRTDLECIYRTHKKVGNSITIVSAMKNIKIPYGIIETNADGSITEITEKPELSYLTNTGMYLIEPEVIEYIQKDEYIHMPDIIRRVKEDGKKVGVFPISEKSWMDMGQMEELEQMYDGIGLK